MTKLSIECKGLRTRPTVVLIHPRGYDMRFWSELMPHLKKRYRCVLAEPNEPGGLRSELGGAHFSVVAVGGSSAAALALGCDAKLNADGILLIDPTLREYVHPHSPFYLGEIVERERDEALSRYATRYASSAPTSDSFTLLRVAGIVDPEEPLLGWQVTLLEMLNDLRDRGDDLQPAPAVEVVARLAEVRCPVLVALGGEGGLPGGTLVEIATRLQNSVRDGRVVRLNSPWSMLVPLADPQRVMELLAELLDYTDSDSLGFQGS